MIHHFQIDIIALDPNYLYELFTQAVAAGDLDWFNYLLQLGLNHPQLFLICVEQENRDMLNKILEQKPSLEDLEQVIKIVLRKPNPNRHLLEQLVELKNASLNGL